MGNRYHTKLAFIVVSVALGMHFVSATETQNITTCDAGTFLKDSGNGSACLPCAIGTFMPQENHTSANCFDCKEMHNVSLEILITPCDRFRDADIQCVEGYYRLQAASRYGTSSCVKCRLACPKGYVQVHPCQNFTDLGCCPGENYDYAVHENGIPHCRERPVMCRKGQFRDTQLNDCKPCPSDTFMHVDFHSYTKCWDCQHESEADLPLHALIAEPCNSAQQSQYNCKAGYYVNHSMISRGDIRCSPCQTCDEGKYVGRQCDMNHDTVCCAKPYMTVEDGPQGGLCVEGDRKDVEGGADDIRIHKWIFFALMLVLLTVGFSVLCFVFWKGYLVNRSKWCQRPVEDEGPMLQWKKRTGGDGEKVKQELLDRTQKQRVAKLKEENKELRRELQEVKDTQTQRVAKLKEENKELRRELQEVKVGEAEQIIPQKKRKSGDGEKMKGELLDMEAVGSMVRLKRRTDGDGEKLERELLDRSAEDVRNLEVKGKGLKHLPHPGHQSPTAVKPPSDQGYSSFLLIF